MRHRHLLSICLLLVACAPGSAARHRARVDPTVGVRVLDSERALAGSAHRVLDTLATSLDGDGLNHRNLAEIRLRVAAAELGANAIVFLDTVSTGKRPRLRGIALRIEESYDDARMLCLHGSAGVDSRARVGACEEVVEREPQNADAWRALAERRHALWDARGERAALERYLALRPGDAKGWYALGRATKGRGNGDEKLAAWRHASELDTTYVDPRLAIGATLAADRARAAEALPWLDAAVRLGGRGEALYQRGRALLQLERWQEAHDAFLAAADSGGVKPTWAHGGAAYALSRAGRHAEAVAMWDRVLAVQPGWFNFAMREHDMIGDEKSAWQRSRKAIAR